MAMTKREQAEMQALLHGFAQALALHLTPAVEPDIDPGMEGGTLFGFRAKMDGSSFSRREPVVMPRWTDSMSNGHAVRNDGAFEKAPRMSGMQGSLKLHSTEARALRALRNEVERKAAEELVMIDLMIAKLEG